MPNGMTPTADARWRAAAAQESAEKLSDECKALGESDLSLQAMQAAKQLAGIYEDLDLRLRREQGAA